MTLLKKPQPCHCKGLQTYKNNLLEPRLCHIDQIQNKKLSPTKSLKVAKSKLVYFTIKLEKVGPICILRSRSNVEFLDPFQ